MKEEILKYIRKNKTATLAMIRKDFSLGYNEAKNILDDLVKENAVNYDNKNCYTPKKTETKKNSIRRDARRSLYQHYHPDGPHRRDTPEFIENWMQRMRDKIQSECDESDDDKSDDDDEEEENVEKSSCFDDDDEEENIEKSSCFDDDDDKKDYFLFDPEKDGFLDDDDNWDATHCNDDRPAIINGERISIDIIDESSFPESTEIKKLYFACRLKRAIKTVQRGTKLFLKSPYKGSDLMFEILLSKGSIYLSDNGSVLEKFGNKDNGKVRDDDVPEAILREFNILRIGDEFQMEVTEDNAFVGFANFCYAIKKICDYKRGDSVLLGDFTRLDRFKKDVIRGIILDKPDIRRTEAILIMKDKYMKCKDSHDYDKIITYAEGVKELTLLNDSQFDNYRKQILSE